MAEDDHMTQHLKAALLLAQARRLEFLSYLIEMALTEAFQGSLAGPVSDSGSRVSEPQRPGP